MNWKKFFVGTLIFPTLIINSPNVSAERVEIFGGEYDKSDSQVEVKKTENEKVEVPPPPVEDIEVKSPPVEKPEVKISEPEKNSANTSKQEDTNAKLNLNDITKPKVEIPKLDKSTDKSRVDADKDKKLDIKPNSAVNTAQQTSQPQSNSSSKTKSSKLKLQKARFIKLTMDETYIYYLDRQSVAWRRMPYSASEMMADVWIRMIERDDENLLPENEVDEIILAKEEGKQYRPEDVAVLKHSHYHLEHYYLRPKTDQIQFLCEIADIEGRPQNTISERKYDYMNWESLVPDSIESRIYRSVINVIGKSRASADNPVTFTDMLEEYARISIR